MTGFLSTRHSSAKIVLLLCLGILVLLYANPQSSAAVDWFSDSNIRSQTDLNGTQKLDASAPYRFQPLFGVDIGAMGLARSAPDPQPLVYSDTAEVIAQSDVLDPGLKLGTRISVSMFNLTRYVPGLDSEVIYFFVDDTVGQAVVDTTGFTTTNVHPVFYGGFPSTPVSSYTLTLDSALRSEEWLIGYRPIPRLKCTAGLRWLQLNEHFDVIETATASSSAPLGFRSESHNRAFGFQVGGEGTLWSNRTARIYTKGKYAVLNNDAMGNAVSQNISFNYSGSSNASLIDFELGSAIWLSRWASLQVAYQTLYLSDAVGALEQSYQQSFFDPASQVPAFHDLRWNGFHLGLSMVW